MTVAEHHIGQLYTVAKQSVAESDGSTAVEIFTNEPFEFTDLESASSTTSVTSLSSSNKSSKSASLSVSSAHSSYTAQKAPSSPFSKKAVSCGQYTHKVYHVGGHLPGWLRAFAPASILKAQERAWNCYPYCYTVLVNDYFGEASFHIVVESLYVDIDEDSEEICRKVVVGGRTLQIKDPENVFELPKETLKQREIYNLDIGASMEQTSFDPASFKSVKTGRGPFATGWTGHPCMMVYKLVTIKTAVFGIQTRLEKHLLDVHTLFWSTY